MRKSSPVTKGGTDSQALKLGEVRLFFPLAAESMKRDINLKLSMKEQ